MTTQSTIAQYEQFIKLPVNADRRFELIEGGIIEMSSSEQHGIITLRIGARILAYADSQHLGRVTVGVGYRVPDESHNVRVPDIAFTSTARALRLSKHGCVAQMPDLAVEVKSFEDTFKNMLNRAVYYLENGVRMVWLVYPEQAAIEVCTHCDTGINQTHMVKSGENLTGADVLPGFTLPLSEIFDIK